MQCSPCVCLCAPYAVHVHLDTLQGPWRLVRFAGSHNLNTPPAYHACIVLTVSSAAITSCPHATKTAIRSALGGGLREFDVMEAGRVSCPQGSLPAHPPRGRCC